VGRAKPGADRAATNSSTGRQGRRGPSGSLGLLPALRESELMMGMKMPPARAVVEGMAGAMRASATDSLRSGAQDSWRSACQPKNGGQRARLQRGLTRRRGPACSFQRP
jgi:hypothetical protein